MNEIENVLSILDASVSCNNLSLKDFEWIKEVIHRRPDSRDHFIDLALSFNDLLDILESQNSDVYKLKLYKIQKELDKLKIFFFRQRTILLAVPQRQKHPRFPAPNLGGIVTPQNYRLKGEVCYGMPHAEARNWLVSKALADPDITDILFIDDDILLPLDAITKLADSNEFIIGANYIKKQIPEESCALSLENGINYYHNKEVPAQEGNMNVKPVSQCGMGACLINIEVFKKISAPWFEFVYNKDGSVFASEDVRFCQKVIIAGIVPKIIPGLVPVHVDFKTGKHYGPEWLVENNYLKSQYLKDFCFFQCDPKECYTENIL